MKFLAWKKSIVDKLVIFRLRFYRGKGYFNEFKEAVVYALFFKVFNIPLWLIIPATILMFVGFYIVGWYDFKYAGIWKRENEYSTDEANPYFQKLKKNIRVKKHD